MYNSSYSRAKLGPDSRVSLHRSKGKSCGYYMRIVFFFSSLIQSLIIVSLVLFLIYGQPEKSAEEKRVKDLELGFNKLSGDNIQLRKELGALQAASAAEKAALEKDMAKLKTDANNTEQELKKKLSFCEAKSAMSTVVRRPTPPIVASPPINPCCHELNTLRSLNARHEALINLNSKNCTQIIQYVRRERDNALKDRDTFNQDAITLRRENAILNEQLSAYTRKCKEDFANSLNGISEVTKSFLNKINTLFPHQLTFHLTCLSQREQMEKIRSSCTNLSREVEDKFQLYLDNVGNKVAEIQSLSSRLEVLNSHTSSDLQECERKSREAAAAAAKKLEDKQKTHDDQVERLLLEQNRLREEKKLLDDSLALKNKEIQNLQRTVPSVKAGSPKVNTPQRGPQLDSRQTPPSSSSVGVPVISKTPTGT